MGIVRRYPFSDIFQQNPDGSLTSKKPIEINGVSFPSGSFFQKGVVYGGIDFHLYKNHSIAVEEEEGSTQDQNTDAPLKIVGFSQE